jgi:hypothetical protein
MTDEELDAACTFVLNRLRDVNPALAANATKEFNNPRYKGLSKAERKLAKVRWLCLGHRAIIAAIFAPENAAWARELKSDMSSFFYMLERRTAFLNPAGEQTGGNYTTKA